MRLLLELSSQCDAAYDLSYYTKLQGFIYTLLRATPYTLLHDKKGYKFFCFSNIFPIGDFKTGDRRKLLISSPEIGLIRLLEEKIKNIECPIQIGELSFKLLSVKTLKPKIPNNLTLITATPIIIRIPRKNYEKYGIVSEKEYVFWQPEYSFEAFIKQLEENIFKKYNEFFGKKIEEFPIFEVFRFKKSTVSRILLDGNEYKLFGSIWEFDFHGLKYDRKRRDVLEFAIDCGFGEKNSMGFGFVNVIGGIK
jgi:CRISPR-associated endoribonuclease Cas6